MARPADIAGRFLADHRGSATVEFVIWIPFFTLWMVLSVGLFDVYMTRNQAAKVAHTLTDIVSRQETMTGAFFNDLDTLQTGLMTRANGATSFRLSSIQLVNDDPTVIWSCSSGGGLPGLSTANVPAGILPTMAPLETVVLVELIVPWDRFAYLGPLTEQEWWFRLPIKPRFTPQMALVDTC